MRLFNMVSSYKKQGSMENKDKATKKKKHLLSEMKRPLPEGKAAKGKVWCLMPPTRQITLGIFINSNS